MFAISIYFIFLTNQKNLIMLQSPLTPEQLAYYQEKHYTQRIAETTDPKALRWLKHQLQCIINADNVREANRANRELSLKFKKYLQC